MKEIVQGMTQGGDKEGHTYLGTVVGPLSFMKVSKKKKKKKGVMRGIQKIAPGH